MIKSLYNEDNYKLTDCIKLLKIKKELCFKIKYFL